MKYVLLSIGLLCLFPITHQICKDLLASCSRVKPYCNMERFVATYKLSCAKTCGYCNEKDPLGQPKPDLPLGQETDKGKLENDEDYPIAPNRESDNGNSNGDKDKKPSSEKKEQESDADYPTDYHPSEDSDDGKKEEPKKDDSNKDTDPPKNDDTPKEDPPKNDDTPKDDPPKNDDTPKEDPPKNDDTPKDEPKTDDTPKEEPKTDDTPKEDSSNTDTNQNSDQPKQEDVPKEDSSNTDTNQNSDLPKQEATPRKIKKLEISEEGDSLFQKSTESRLFGVESRNKLSKRHKLPPIPENDKSVKISDEDDKSIKEKIATSDEENLIPKKYKSHPKLRPTRLHLSNEEELSGSGDEPRDEFEPSKVDDMSAELSEEEEKPISKPKFKPQESGEDEEKPIPKPFKLPSKPQESGEDEEKPIPKPQESEEEPKSLKESEEENSAADEAQLISAHLNVEDLPEQEHVPDEES